MKLIKLTTREGEPFWLNADTIMTVAPVRWMKDKYQVDGAAITLIGNEAVFTVTAPAVWVAAAIRKTVRLKVPAIHWAAATVTMTSHE